jgi:tRNA uridine 5-carboxymethylaminomethyl modification enzyme
MVVGCIGPERAQKHRTKMSELDAARTLARSLTVTPSEAAKQGLSLRKDGQRRSAFELLSYPDIGLADLARLWPELGNFDRKIADQLETDAKYEVYLSRQAADVESYRRDEGLVLAADVDYATLPGLSNEVRHKLETHRPRTVGQAGRIDGVTPAALTLLAAHLRRQHRKPDRGAA